MKVKKLFPVIRTIKERFSVRTYIKRPLSGELVSELDKYVRELNQTHGPFKTSASISFASAYFGNEPIGTYGMIKNASEYFVGVSKNEFEYLVDFGYIFEKLILFATSRGLGTCWMSGTFDRKDFTSRLQLEEEEYIPAISPVGYSHEKTSIRDQSLRFLGRSKKRGSWESMFFDKALNPIKFNEYHRELKIPLEMVRLAPSGRNKQPWKLVICEDEHCVHFYSKGSSTHFIDMGIAMCHFELGCKARGVSGQWLLREVDLPLEETYIMTFHWE